MKPKPEFIATPNCELEVEFENHTTFGSGYDDVADTILYIWDFGDDNSVTYNKFDPNTYDNESPTHTYAEPGTYEVTLTAVDDYCSTIITKEVIVPETPDFVVKDSMICMGDEIDIHILQPSLEDAVYEWRESNDETAPVIYVGNVYTRSFTEDKTFWITASEENTECTFTREVTISVQEFPDIEIKGDTLICEGDQTTLTAIDNSGLTEAMQWTLNKPSDPPVMTNPTTNPIYTISPNSSTTIYLIARTSQGCLSWKSVDITVIDPIVTASKTKVCPGDKVTLTGDRAVTYSWSSSPLDPTLTTDTSDAPVTAYPEETTLYMMRGYGQTGCYSERNIRVEVVPRPIATISYTPSFVDTDNPVIALRDDSKYGAKSKWDLSDGTTSYSRSFNHRFDDLSSDEVAVFLTSYNEVGDHCFDTASLTLPVQLFSVWVPNAFAPVGDGVNDYFFFHSVNEFTEVKFEVFNKWSSRVFVYENKGFLGYDGMEVDLGWDGTYNGKPAPVGTYTWRLTYKRPGNNRTYDRYGTLNLIR